MSGFTLAAAVKGAAVEEAAMEMVAGSALCKEQS